MKGEENPNGNSSSRDAGYAKIVSRSTVMHSLCVLLRVHCVRYFFVKQSDSRLSGEQLMRGSDFKC